jgi:drug/metabolite transporter (DMT)-like permease
MDSTQRSIPVSGAVCGLAAAMLFGLSAPLAKLLLPSTGTLMMAGLLYLGAGAGLAAAGFGRSGRRSTSEARLHREDLKPLGGIVLLGGIVGPILMMYGLGRVSAVAGSLLLNLEAPLTIAVAAAFFHEHLGRRLLLAATLIFAGALILAKQPGDLHPDALGVIAICGACLSWAIDNNLTQQLSLRDPVAVVRIKALGAGICTFALALLAGEGIPPPLPIAAAMLVGAFCYGLSILLDTYALRALGAAREAAFFATAPFVGAIAAMPLLGERLTGADAGAMLLMAAGVAGLLRENHSHLHIHDPIEHDHAHVHDDHHRHEHSGPVAAAEPHAHPHQHTPLTHDHPHVPDLHHRHRH